VGLEEALDRKQGRWPVPAKQADIFAFLEPDVDAELATNPDAYEGFEHRLPGIGVGSTRANDPIQHGGQAGAVVIGST
jgi:hypothetical protein